MIGFESLCWWVGFEKYFGGIFFRKKGRFPLSSVSLLEFIIILICTVNGTLCYM